MKGNEVHDENWSDWPVLLYQQCFGALVLLEIALRFEPGFRSPDMVFGDDHIRPGHDYPKWSCSGHRFGQSLALE